MILNIRAARNDSFLLLVNLVIILQDNWHQLAFCCCLTNSPNSNNVTSAIIEDKDKKSVFTTELQELSNVDIFL